MLNCMEFQAQLLDSPNYVTKQIKEVMQNKLNYLNNWSTD